MNHVTKVVFLRFLLRCLCSFLLCFAMLMPPTAAQAEKEQIKIGINFEFTGTESSIPDDLRKGMALALKPIKAQGGIKSGGKTYPVSLIEYDNGDNKSMATSLALKAISRDKIIALILPFSSNLAVQVAGVANAYKTPSVATTATSSEITKQHPYAFRTAAGFKDFAKATVKLSNQEWKAKKIAILYDELSNYSKHMTHAVLEQFAATHGTKNSIVKTYRTGDTNFNKQLKEIIAFDADFLYVPQYPKDVVAIIQQARKLGWKKPITGSDTWGLPELLKQCGNSYCKGLFFTANFIAKGATGSMQSFVNLYKKEYSTTPSEAAAFGYESLNIILQALQQTKKITGKIQKDRAALRNSLAAIRYKGASGKISYKRGSGEPVKCALVVRIDDKGEFSRHMTVCP